jgi:hypothetical protein
MIVRRLLVDCSSALLALGSLVLPIGCSSGVQAADPTVPRVEEEPPASPPAPGTAFERRWSYLSANTAPDHSSANWNGALDGAVTLWHENGTKKAEGRYEHSQRVGPWIFWHDNGQVRWQGTYVDGDVDGRELAWYANGQLELESNWKGGRREGVFAQWHENGQLAAQGEYRRGKREGRFQFFRADGSVDEASSGRYEDDVRVGD